jgi:hypothetical protein
VTAIYCLEAIVPIVQYRIASVNHGDMFSAARKAVFGTVLTREEYSTGDDQLWFDVLRRRWRKRLSGLKAAGWDLFKKHPKAIAYACNCPPFGVKIADFKPLRVCNRRQFCPFCWGRFVFSVYMGARQVFYCDEDDESPAKGLHLLAFRYEREFPAGTPSHVPGTVLEFLGHRHFELEQISKPAGAVVLNTAYYTSTGLHVSRRGLVAFRGRHQLKPHDLRKVREFKAPTRQELREAIEWTCRYPARLLSCPGEGLKAILEVTKKSRMFAFYGDMRPCCCKEK